MSTVDFIGTGAQKSATMWIKACLYEHPDICWAHDGSGKRIGGVHFFDKYYDRGMQWYTSLWSHCSLKKVRGEYTPMYLFDPAVPARIKKHCPDVKIIACLRNPTDRAFSQYNYGKDMWGGRNFEEALEVNPELIERGLYYEQLKRYFDLFEREQILVLIYEDIQKDPAAFMQRIYRFLEIDDSFVPSAAQGRAHETRHVAFRSGALEAFRQLARRILRTLPFKKTVVRASRSVGAHKAERAIQKMNTKATDKKPVLAPETRTRLHKTFANDIINLEKLLHTDLSHWK